jgi:hypothetical protein
VGLLQRVLDEHGIPTVSLTQCIEITRLVKPSLACYVEHPFGLTLGAAHDKATQRAVLERCLAEAEQPHPPGTIVDLGFRWTRDDLREQQFAKTTEDDLAALRRADHARRRKAARDEDPRARPGSEHTARTPEP